MANKKAQGIKILVLLIFVSALVFGSIFLYNHLVKDSPYLKPSHGQSDSTGR
jgi:hypothetical protein